MEKELTTTNISERKKNQRRYFAVDVKPTQPQRLLGADKGSDHNIVRSSLNENASQVSIA